MTRHGPKGNPWPYLLSEVDRLTAVVTIAEAAATAGLEAEQLLVLLHRSDHSVPFQAGESGEVRLVDALLAAAYRSPTGGPGPRGPIAPRGPLSGPPGMISTAEAAARLGMRARWVRELARRGRIRGAVRHTNGCWYFWPDELAVLPSQFERQVPAGTIGVNAVADLLQLPRDTVRSMAKNGQLPAERDGHGRWRFWPEKLRLVQVALATGEAPPYNFFTRSGSRPPRRRGAVEDAASSVPREHR